MTRRSEASRSSLDEHLSKQQKVARRHALLVAALLVAALLAPFLLGQLAG